MANEAEQHEASANGLARQSMDGRSIERRDTASLAMAEKQKALVQARIVQAMQFPRDEFQFRDRILKSCKRAAFAETAIYAKPMGKKPNPVTGAWEDQFARGLSIRFAEESARLFANLDIGQVIIHDDPEKRIIYVTATDLESNFTTSQEVIVTKTIERKKVKEGQTVIAQRENSYGEIVFIIEANEDEVATKTAAALSKVRRNLILQMIPGDIQDEAWDAIEATRVAGANAIDPVAARKTLVDRFSTKLGVTPAMLAEFLAKNIDDATREEMRDLNDIANAIEDKTTTWRDVMAARGAVTGEGEVKPADVAKATKVEQALKESKAKRAKPVAPPIASTTAPDAAITGPDPKFGQAEADKLVENADSAADAEELGVIRGALVGATARLSAENFRRVENAIAASDKRINPRA